MVILMLTNAMVNLNTAITLSSIESAQERLVDQNSKAGLTARAAISLLAGVCWEEFLRKGIYCCVHRMNGLKQEFGGRGGRWGRKRSLSVL